MSARPPMSPQAARAALLSAAFHLTISKYYALAATVMLVYDTFLTFDREVAVVWKSKWTGVKLLYCFNRYANIIAYLAALIAINSVWPTDVCRRYVYFPGIFNIIQQVVIGAILILFTWALFNRSNIILAIVVVTLIAQLVVTGWSLGAVTSVPLPPGLVGCIYAGKKGSGVRIQTAWFMQLVFIAVVFGLMIWKSARLHKAQIKAPLITVITRDGVKYFGVIFGINFVNVMNFTLVKDTSLKSVHATFSALLTVIMINRLILSVREETTRTTFIEMTSKGNHFFRASIMDSSMMTYNGTGTFSNSASSSVPVASSTTRRTGNSEPLDDFEMDLRDPQNSSSRSHSKAKISTSLSV